jgi:hypothetical protein
MQTFNQAVDDLCERGFNKFSELDSQTVAELAALKALEMPNVKMPLLADIDVKELILMVSKWINNNDYELRDDIMEKLENLVSKAFSYSIQREFELWNKQNEHDLYIAAQDREQLEYAYNRQRI